jgi:hypothetical protein
VGFLVEFFWALLMAGLPIAIFTLAIVWWALEGKHFKELTDSKSLENEIKAFSKNLKVEKKANKAKGNKTKAKQHPILSKWSSFGGGFYGIVAFFTYIVVEVREVIEVIINFGGFIGFLKQLDIGLIVDMFINAIMNFITAIVWPVYWLERIESAHVWIWFVVAYLGYRTGLRTAQIMKKRRAESKT